MSFENSDFEKLPLRPERDVALEYTIPFEWGNLAVSQAAHNQYGLVQLSANRLKNDQERTEDPTIMPVIDILLVGHEEAAQYIPNLGEANAGSAVNYHRGGVEIVMASGVSKDDLLSGDIQTYDPEVRNLLINIGSAVLGHDPEFLDHNSTEQVIPQAFAHIFSELAGFTTVESMKIWLEANQDHQLLSQLRSIGKITLASVAVLGIFGGLFGNAESAAVAGISVSAFEATLAYHGVKKHFKTRPAREFASNIYAAARGSQITSAIHGEFCASEFNHNNSVLDPDNPELPEE